MSSNPATTETHEFHEDFGSQLCYCGQPRDAAIHLNVRRPLCPDHDIEMTRNTQKRIWICHKRGCTWTLPFEATDAPIHRAGSDTEAERYKRNRASAFCTKFAYPVSDEDQKARQCLTCRDNEAPLYRTYFQGTSIPAFMCVLCIKAAHKRVTEFLIDWEVEHPCR